MTGAAPDLRQLLPFEQMGRTFAESASEDELAELYLEGAGDPGERWLRVNMVSTVDGAASGSDGRSGSISTAADKRVFAVLRGLADAVLVGEGTIAAERYTSLHEEPAHVQRRLRRGQRAVPPLVIATSGADVDLDRLQSAGTSEVILIVGDAVPPTRLAEVRDRLGEDSVIEAGGQRADLRRGLDALAERGLRHVLGEGGPRVLASLAGEGLLDELDLTLSPRLAGGDTFRILNGAPADLSARPHTLISDGRTLLGRWMIRGAGG